MQPASTEKAPPGPRERWQAEGTARRYAGERWSSDRKRERDPRLVAALLRAHAGSAGGALILDVPCGTGRLRSTLKLHGRYVGLDVSPAMLAEARVQRPGDGGLLLGDLERLPFQDGSFDVVVCCRLLHHLREDEALQRVLSELLRVCRGVLIASFWDSTSLPAWRRALFPTGRAPRRWARSRAEMVRALVTVGAEALAWKSSLRFVSRQTFFVVRKKGRP